MSAAGAAHHNRQARRRVAASLAEYADEFAAVRITTTQDGNLLRLIVRQHRPDLAPRVIAAQLRLAEALTELAATATATAATLEATRATLDADPPPATVVPW